MQTILGLTKRIKHRLPYDRVNFKLQDGGEIGLDFLEPNKVGCNATR